MTRKIDPLGRVVLPVELRRRLGLHEGALVDIRLEHSVGGETIVLAPVADRCVFCHGTAALLTFAAKRVCAGCVARLASGTER